MAEQFDGFANAVNPKGEAFDAREVDAYVDESEAGKIRDASISTPSSITQFKTDGKGTNGAPMAVVGKQSTSTDEAESAPDAEDVEPDAADEPSVPEPSEDESTPSDEDSVAETPTDPAGGKEGDES